MSLLIFYLVCVYIMLVANKQLKSYELDLLTSLSENPSYPEIRRVRKYALNCYRQTYKGKIIEIIFSPAYLVLFLLLAITRKGSGYRFITRIEELQNDLVVFPELDYIIFKNKVTGAFIGWTIDDFMYASKLENREQWKEIRSQVERIIKDYESTN